jgi:hypothetical protein
VVMSIEEHLRVTRHFNAWRRGILGGRGTPNAWQVIDSSEEVCRRLEEALQTIEKQRREIEALRLFGNTDCTRMADEHLAAGRGQQEEVAGAQE